MTVSLVSQPVWRVYDNSGALAVGAQVYTYQATTTTPQATYTDSTGVTPNPNPIVTNSRGEFTAWFTDGLSYKLIAKDASGNTLWTQDNVTSQGSLSLTLAGSGGSNLVGFIQSGTGAVARTMQDKGRDVVNAADFGVSASNGDNSTQLQAFINKCSSNASDCPEGILPAGTLQFATPLNFPSMFNRLRGAGKNLTVLKFTGAGSALKPAAQAYFRPSWSDFQVDATTNSAALGIDFSAITSQVYDGSLERLTVYAGGDAIYAPHIFSMKIDTVRAGSGSGHAFRMNCGPGVTWINCYAASSGTGKAGYRLAGEILMLACNGVDSGERWGVFGSNNAASDGFQNDFPGVTDFPRVHLINCNFEAFSLCGLMFQNSYRYVNIEGGKFDRSILSSAYESQITITAQGTDVNAPFWLNPAFWNPGSGTPTNGAGATVWVKSGSVCVVEMTGGQIGQVYDSNGAGVGVGALVPTVSMGVIQDVLSGRALYLNALRADRLSIGFTRYISQSYVPASLPSQVIDVTGVGMAVVSPAAAGGISKATFTDASRNGDLYIQAGNANLTIQNGGGADNFKMGADLVCYAGQVVHFVRNNAGFWSQV